MCTTAAPFGVLQGAQVFAIGVTKAIDFNELVEIAGSNDSVILVDDFTKLDHTARTTLLSKRKCKFVTGKCVSDQSVIYIHQKYKCTQ